jgi:predicted ATP-binding protein involved in virulence
LPPFNENKKGITMPEDIKFKELADKYNAETNPLIKEALYSELLEYYQNAIIYDKKLRQAKEDPTGQDLDNF